MSRTTAACATRSTATGSASPFSAASSPVPSWARRDAHQEPVGQPQRAEGEGPRPDEAALLEAGDLQAAPADVHHQPGFDVQAVEGPQEGEPGFLVAVDDADLKAAVPPDLLHQLLAVLGLPDRRRRHHQDLGRPGPLGDRPEVADGLRGAPHGLRAQAGVVLDVPAQAQRRTAVRQHLQVPPRPDPDDHHPAGVGSDVDDGERSLHASGTPAAGGYGGRPEYRFEGARLGPREARGPNGLPAHPPTPGPSARPGPPAPPGPGRAPSTGIPGSAGWPGRPWGTSPPAARAGRPGRPA